MKNLNILIWLFLLLVIAGCVQQIETTKKSTQTGFDVHVDAKHYLKDKRELVHHWCKPVSDDLIQCMLFDSDKPDANLIGAEMIISNAVWNTFAGEEKAIWHDHATEIIEAEATLPDMKKEDAEKLVEALKGTHGRVIYFWNFPVDKWPTVMPFIDMENE